MVVRKSLLWASSLAVACGGQNVPIATAPTAHNVTKAASSLPPPAERRSVTDEYHGVRVADDYQWLENDKDPQVQAWSTAQNAYTRGVLNAITERKAIRDEVSKIVHSTSPNYFALD